jgi:outer membrane receptor for ferrienterochelin and colicin
VQNTALIFWWYLMKCDGDCFNCKFKDCILEYDEIEAYEELDEYVLDTDDKKKRKANRLYHKSKKYKEYQRIYRRNYYKTHKLYFKKWKHKYYLNNREKILKRQKKYREKHQKEIRERREIKKTQRLFNILKPIVMKRVEMIMNLDKN